MTDPNLYRAEADRALATELLLHPTVRPLLLELADQEESTGTRRSLLAQALRLSPEIAPELNGIVAHCRTQLAIETEVELYVYPGPSFNAACTAPEGERVFVLLSSSLAEAFTHDELTFVVGHELGHHVYNHHDVPVGLLARSANALPASVVLRMLSWQRHAEISADRTGLVCSGGLQPAAAALFKLSSGLSRTPDEAQIEAYLAQAEMLHAESDPERGASRGHADWMSSHPFSPLRLTAARAFSRSEYVVEGGSSLAQVEREVAASMELMEASYLEEDSLEAEHMRRVLLAGGLVLAAADGEVSEAELAHLRELLGPAALPLKPNVEALAADLPIRLDRMRERVRPTRRARVLHDLAALARADGQVDHGERDLLIAWARDLHVDPCVVVECLESVLELD